MTNKEAITYLEWLSNIDFSKKNPKYTMVTNPEQVEALQMAIEALSADGDTISRQAAINILYDFAGCIVDTPNGDYQKAYQAYRHRLDILPSAQPEPLSVRESDADHIWYKDKQFISLTRINKMLIEHPKYTDTISRAAAIDHWRLIIDATNTDSKYNMGFVDGLEFCISHLSTMPSVQPEPEHTMEEFMYGQDIGNPEDGSL